VPFAYYRRLSRREQAVYRRSDAMPAVPLPRGTAEEVRPAVEALRAALVRDDAPGVAAAAAEIAGRIARALGGRAPVVRVLAVRPSRAGGELHGLYTLAEDAPAVIQVWMRTARRGQVVAFRTFLRTLLHEVCHHLDLTVIGLPWSFHTEGFFQRESSLFRQIVPPDAPGHDPAPKFPGERGNGP
jgi:hypothetical protein